MKAWIKLDSLTSWLLSVDWRCSMGKTICQNGTHDQAEPCLICSIYHLLCCWCGSALLEHESCNDGDGKKSTASTRLESSVFTFLQMLTCFCTFKHHILANTTIVQIQFWLFMISGHVWRFPSSQIPPLAHANKSPQQIPKRSALGQKACFTLYLFHGLCLAVFWYSEMKIRANKNEYFILQ